MNKKQLTETISDLEVQRKIPQGSTAKFQAGIVTPETVSEVYKTLSKSNQRKLTSTLKKAMIEEAEEILDAHQSGTYRPKVGTIAGQAWPGLSPDAGRHYL